ncbi:MAG: pilus assembly protein PilM [Planctomycetota bacterium]
MASDSVCWGIELGSGAIKALKLGANASGEVEVLDFIVIPHKKPLSAPDIDPDDAVRVAVGQLASQYDLTGAPIAVSVPGSQSFARFAKLPPVEPKQVAGVVKFEAGQQIPFDLDEVEWDYQTFVSPDSPEVEVGIFAITKQRIDRELRLLRDVGLNPDTVTVGPVATYNAMAYDLQFTEDTPGTVIMDVGTNSTDLIVADKGRVWIRTFPIGGHHFTEALVEKFNLSYPKAERLKREAERSKHSRHVFQAMKGVFADLAQETQRSIGYHKSLHPDGELKRVIGVGSTFRLPGLRRFLKQQLQMDVYRMDEFKRLSLDGPRAGEFGAVSVEMPVAYGLALQGLGMQTIDANLMPISMVREGVWQKKTKWFGVAAGLGLAASAAMFIRWAIDNSEIQGSSAPDVINTAVRSASTLRSEAEEAGVLGGTQADPAVQELLQLPNGREVYGHVVADLADLLATTNGVASVDRAVEMVSFRTDFVPAGGGDAGGGSRGRQDRGRFSASDSQPDPYPEASKIDVTLDVRVREARPADFLIESVGGWLSDNGDRTDVPYVIVAQRELDYRSLDASSESTGRGFRGRPRGESGFDDDGSGGVQPGAGMGGRTSDRGSDRGFDRGGDRAGGGVGGQPAFRGGDGGLPAIPRPDADDGPAGALYQVRYRLALVPPEARQSGDGSSDDGMESGE